MNQNTGVEPGNAAYMREPAIGRMHDRHTGRDPLAVADIRFVLDSLAQTTPGWIADFGCGTGRTFAALGQAGWKVVGVDMSWPMLVAATERIADEGQNGPATAPAKPVLIQSSLTDMTGLKPASLDAAICLYSTLGMIRGRKSRGRFLKQAFQSVRDGGEFFVHAHNVWSQRRFPGGWRWLAGNAIRAIVSSQEFGDRWANAYGVKGLFIHSFRFGELIRDLAEAGWKPQTCLVHLSDSAELGQQKPKPVSAVSRREKTNSPGWIVACRKPDANGAV